MHLACCLVYERQHNVERYAMTLKQRGGKGIAAVDEVAGKDCGKMQVASGIGTEDIHT